MHATGFDHGSSVQALVHILLDVFDATQDLYQTLAIKEERDYDNRLRSKGYPSSRQVDYIKDENLGSEAQILQDKKAVKRQFDIGHLEFGIEFARGDVFAHNSLQSQIINLQSVLIKTFLYGPTSTDSISEQLSKVNAASKVAGMTTVQILRDLPSRQGRPPTPQWMRLQADYPTLSHSSPHTVTASGIDCVQKDFVKYNTPLGQSTRTMNSTGLSGKNTVSPDRNVTGMTSTDEPKSDRNNSAGKSLYCPFASDLQQHRDLPLSSTLTSSSTPNCPICKGTLHVSPGKAWELYKEDDGFDRCFQVSNRFVVKCHRGGPDGQYACVICSDSTSVNTICGNVKALVKHLWSDHTIRDLKLEEDIVEVIEQPVDNSSDRAAKKEFCRSSRRSLSRASRRRHKSLPGYNCEVDIFDTRSLKRNA